MHFPNLTTKYAREPLAFPIYGRGLILYALVGAGINPWTISEAASFVTGPCSCEVKAGNPGTDMLLTLDWDALQAFDKAIKIAPRNADARYARGDVLYELGHLRRLSAGIGQPIGCRRKLRGLAGDALQPLAQPLIALAVFLDQTGDAAGAVEAEAVDGGPLYLMQAEHFHAHISRPHRLLEHREPVLLFARSDATNLDCARPLARLESEADIEIIGATTAHAAPTSDSLPTAYHIAQLTCRHKTGPPPYPPRTPLPPYTSASEGARGGGLSACSSGPTGKPHTGAERTGEPYAAAEG